MFDSYLCVSYSCVKFRPFNEVSVQKVPFFISSSFENNLKLRELKNSIV